MSGLQGAADAIAGTPVLDDALLGELEPFGATFLVELVDTFETQVGILVRDVHVALAAADTGALHRAAHTLKGSAASIGASRCSAAAAAVDRAGQEGDLEGAAGVASGLASLGSAAVAALRARVRELPE